MRTGLARVAWAALAAAAALPAGCGSHGASELTIVAVADGDALVRSATAEGLVSYDEQGRVIPALADRWIVLDDGQSYIFRLRDGTWSDGAPLTAASAQAALRNAIAATRGGALALDLGVIDSVRAMAPRVIEIRLRQPMPELLQLLAQPELGLRRRGSGAGPMKRIEPGKGDAADHGITLKPINPRTLGLPEISDWTARTRHVDLLALAAPAAVARFDAGNADLLLGGRAESFPLAAALGVSRGTIRLDPVRGLFGLVALDADGALASARTREALAMAIDRAGLIGAFNISGWAAATRIVPPGIEDDPGTSGDRWTALTLDQRRAAARATLADATGRAPPPPLRIMLPDGPGSDLLFARLRQDFASVGVTALRAGARERADLRLVDLVTRYPRVAWFLDSFACRARRGLCDPGTDALVDAARAAPDPATAARLIGEALASLTAANVFIPLAAPLRWSLVRGDVTGFAANTAGAHPLMPMAMRPR